MKSQSYEAVQQVEELDDAPILVEAIPPMEQVVSENNEHSETDQVKCAGCMGATAGCLTGGWCIALVCCTGCIYCAKQEGVAGEVALGCGSMGISANVMVRDFVEEHNVAEKSKVAADVVWSKAKQTNEDYQIVSRTKSCVVTAVRTGLDFTKEHRIVERTAKGVGSIMSTVAKELAPSSSTASNTVATEEQSETNADIEFSDS